MHRCKSSRKLVFVLHFHTFCGETKTSNLWEAKESDKPIKPFMSSWWSDNLKLFIKVNRTGAYSLCFYFSQQRFPFYLRLKKGLVRQIIQKRL